MSANKYCLSSLKVVSREWLFLLNFQVLSHFFYTDSGGRMEDSLILTLGKYISWIISAVAGLFIWFALLVVIDDTGMWHFEYASFIADILRIAVIVVTGGIALAVGILLNYLFNKLLHRNTLHLVE